MEPRRCRAPRPRPRPRQLFIRPLPSRRPPPPREIQCRESGRRGEEREGAPRKRVDRGLVARARLRGRASGTGYRPPFIRRHVTRRPMDDPWTTRGRPVSIASAGYSFISLLRAGNFKFDYKLPERAPHVLLLPLPLPLLRRRDFRVSSSSPSTPSCPHSRPPTSPSALFLSLFFLRRSRVHSFSRVRSDEKLFVARSRRNYWPAGFIYSIHFPGNRGAIRRSPTSAIFLPPFLILFSFR